jgi:hypothetical protein
VHQSNNTPDNTPRSKSKQSTLQNQVSERSKNIIQKENSRIQTFEEKNNDKTKSN